jgi:hypothetical protein
MSRDLFKGYRTCDYPEVSSVSFPKEIQIAFAVCGERCGRGEFIADGETLICPYCGRLMHRSHVRRYILADEETSE